MPLLGGLLGGQRLGNAHGTITIDTSGAERASLTMRRVGQTINKAFSGIERSARTFSTEISKVNRELTALGITGGIISAMGIRAAASFEEVQVQLVGMVGSLEEATKLTEELRKSAGDAGLPFGDLLQAAKQLLPTLEGNTEQLQDWLDLTRRVSVLNQKEGITGAAFAINEALTSGGTDLVSLTERFNISRVALREALEETGDDFGAALDIVLTKMGITQQTADEMGRTFNASFTAAKDAAIQLLAEGFEPILDILTPMLRGTADWLNKLRETSPAIATLGAGLASFAAVGAPALLFLNQIILSLQRIKTLKAAASLGPMLGAAGVLGGAGALGGGIAVRGVRAIGRATNNEQLAEATIGDAWEAFRQLTFIIRTGLSKFGAEIAKVLAQGAAWMLEGFANVADTLAMFVQRLLDLIPGPDIGRLAQAREWSEAAQQSADSARTLAESLANSADAIDQKQLEYVSGLAQRLGVVLQTTQDPAGGDRDGPGRGSRFDADQTEAISDWAEQVQEIERDANNQRLQATEQYESQRTETIAGYEKTIARDAQDFARSRARQANQLTKSIAGIHVDAAKRERRWQQELSKRTAAIRAEGSKRIVEIEAEGQRNLERMRKDHRNRLMTAAANLDARAVAEEQRRFQGQITGAEDELQQRLTSERESQQERINQAREAHQERLEEARAADAQRIQEMKDSLAEQQALEDETRTIRLTRMQEDHDAQLEAMEEAQKERIDQIAENVAEERTAAWEGLVERLDDLGIHNQAWLSMQAKQQEQSLKLFDLYWKAWQARMTQPAGSSRTVGSLPVAPQTAVYDPRTGSYGPPSGPQISRQAGGPVFDTAATMLHGSRSRPEYVLSADTTAMLKGALGGSFNQQQLVGAVAGGGGMTIQSGAFSMPIYAAPGQNPADIGRAVEQALTGFFRGLTE